MRADGPQRIALLVGVGRYYQAPSGHKPWPTLHTRREIEEYRDLLIRDYGFTASDVQVLQDEEATTARIRAVFRSHLIERARPGDVVLFHFSGHGQRLPDDPARLDEPDGLDESLVTYDAIDQSWQEGSAKNIRDDELGDWLSALAGRMRPQPAAPLLGNITVTLDACYAGSATRGTLTARGRSWEVGQDGPLPKPVAAAPDEGGAGLLDPMRLALRDVTVVAAARADQTAWERDGQGVFTRCWVRLLARAARMPTLSYKAAVDRLTLDLAAEGLDQTPQVEGAAAKPLFSPAQLPDVRSPTTWRVLRHPDGTVFLQAGEVHGVTEGSVYSLYEPEALATDLRGSSSQLAEATVVKLWPFTAQLELPTSARLEGKAGAVAIETRHRYALRPLRVVLRGMQRQRALRDRIAALAQVQVVEELRGTEVPSVDHDLLIARAPPGEALRLYRAPGQDSFVTLDLRDDRDGIEKLSLCLRKAWRRHHFASLRNENSAAWVEAELIPVHVEYGADHTARSVPVQSAVPSPAPHLMLPGGSVFGLQLRNRSQRDLYVTVLAISPDGDLDILFGDRERGENRIGAGRLLAPPLETQVLHRLSGEPGDRVLIKVIATVQFVDFSALRPVLVADRGGTRSSTPPGTDVPLQDLLLSWQMGTRGSTLAQGPADWGTTDASVTVAPRSATLTKGQER